MVYINSFHLWPYGTIRKEIKNTLCIKEPDRIVVPFVNWKKQYYSFLSVACKAVCSGNWKYSLILQWHSFLPLQEGPETLAGKRNRPQEKKVKSSTGEKEQQSFTVYAADHMMDDLILLCWLLVVFVSKKLRQKGY